MQETMKTFIYIASSLLTIAMLVYFSQGVIINQREIEKLREEKREEESQTKKQ